MTLSLFLPEERDAAPYTYVEAAHSFESALPHKSPPFDSRNWGHGLHSLCSYQGKLKPALAYFLIGTFTNPGDRVLDPMAGSGTIPLEAMLQGRVGIGNDIQELAYTLTRAKTEPLSHHCVNAEMKSLLAYVEAYKGQQNTGAYADFGYNGKVGEYFHPDTYQEVLAAREYMLSHPCVSADRAAVYASVLHILHGNRPYALSRNSHPVTPFQPTGDSEYRPLKPRLTDKVARVLALPQPIGMLRGDATRLPFDRLSFDGDVDAVITSPPFAASTRFYIANWMRLWMAGWEPSDFTSRRDEFLEERQKRSMDAYHTFFACCARWLKPRGRLILHLGKTASCDMAAELIARAGDEFTLIHTFDEGVLGREKFGIRDQGATTSHQFVFFERNG